MRSWLLTNTTYGTWLPGDPRGSVTSVRDRRPEDQPSPCRFEHDVPGEPDEEEIPGLRRSALEHLKGPPIYLDVEKAEVILPQLQETATFRGWTLRAVAIMANHFHLVVQVPDDPNPGKILADFKAYGSRALNRRYGKPPSETWWTERGSKRKLRDERAVANAIHYALDKQPFPLVVWSPERGHQPKGEPGASATGVGHAR
jgi:REP element-mobilizing transposase RayT